MFQLKEDSELQITDKELPAIQFWKQFFVSRVEEIMCAHFLSFVGIMSCSTLLQVAVFTNEVKPIYEPSSCDVRSVEKVATCGIDII